MVQLAIGGLFVLAGTVVFLTIAPVAKKALGRDKRETGEKKGQLLFCRQSSQRRSLQLTMESETQHWQGPVTERTKQMHGRLLISMGRM